MSNEWTKSIGVVGRMLLAFAVILSQAAFAGQNQRSQDKAEPSAKASAQQAGEKQTPAATTPKVQTEEAKGEAAQGVVAEEKPSRDGSHEGIKVHGHWTIEVRNPDGALVAHHEFENSYQGGNFLPLVLARSQSVGPWAIILTANSTSVCAGGVSPGCFMVEPAYPGARSQFPNTSLTLSSSGTAAVLMGSTTAASSGSIVSVATSNVLCAPTTAPASPCSGGGGSIIGNVTGTNLATPIAVSAGQIIQVTVAISFS